MSKGLLCQRCNYELFNYSKVSLHLRSWNYRGCWHQTFPLIVSQGPLCPPSIVLLNNHFCNCSGLFLVTTSPFRHWVIFAPAASLRSGGHLSGPLSGVKPLSSVTRHHHRSPLYYHPQLIGQILI